MIKESSKRVPNFDFLGVIPFSEVQEYFSRAAILVNTSMFEGFPHAFIQAWEHYVPVVSLNADPDGLICENKMGFHSKTFNQLVEDVKTLLKNKALIEEKELPEELLKGTETVLFVDDEEMIREVGGALLGQLGYKVLSAGNGKEAVEVYSNNKDKIDIVILDMIMPEMGGDKAYDKMKEINPDIKVLLSSGYSVNGDATKILERGCDGFIQKPFNMKQLSKSIREILDK